MVASASTALQSPSGPWNPGLTSQVPKEWRELATIYRAENTYTPLAAAEELHGLTGFEPSELVVFRPERLALHELLIRVTADFAVPDGSRIEDLGINFRRMANRLLTQYLMPDMRAITLAFEQAQGEMTGAVEAALAEVWPAAGPAPASGSTGRFAFLRLRRRAAPAIAAEYAWDARHIALCERRAGDARDPLAAAAYRCVARVLSALFTTHGCAWGTRELIVRLARDLAGNSFCSDAVGRAIDPALRRGAALEGYGLLPRQAWPVVINTKGASASGKSTLRPLQKSLAGDIGIDWNEFALISPDIWRKQLLDYASLGAAYRYAGAFTGEELQIVDHKLDRYMARKQAAGNMSHLLIDRFRFDSFAPDSGEAGSNLLTRFGRTVFLFFMITPPEQLVERAWKRGLEFGRYKAVDDTLAHAVDAYTGMPNVFFTWVRRSDKCIRFEFLDNSVALGERPRTAVFGDNDSINVLDVKRMLDIERYGRVFVDAAGPEQLYPDRALLAPAHNVGFLKRCVEGFRRVDFAEQASGRIYLRLESGAPAWVDAEALRAALKDADTRAGIEAVAPAALKGGVPAIGEARYLRRHDASCAAAEKAAGAVSAASAPQALPGPQAFSGPQALPTLGVWGGAASLT